MAIARPVDTVCCIELNATLREAGAALRTLIRLIVALIALGFLAGFLFTNLAAGSLLDAAADTIDDPSSLVNRRAYDDEGQNGHPIYGLDEDTGKAVE